MSHASRPPAPPPAPPQEADPGTDEAAPRLIEISLPVEGELVEPVWELFERHGGGAVLETRIRGPREGEPSAPPKTWVKTYLPADDLEARARIEVGLWHLGQILPLPEAELRLLADANWAEAWKAHYEPQRIGPFLVLPSWHDEEAVEGSGEEASPEDAGIPIRLDPGMAFGTGQHPSTRLCLELLGELLRPGQHVLDVGTGSGILAIGAARLGAASVTAVDIDPRAARTAAENARVNGVEILAAAGSLEPTPPERPFDLVLANILAPTIRALAPALAAHTRPGGRLVASGVLEEQAADVARALQAEGFAAPALHRDGDWVALVAARGEAPASG